MDERYLSRGKRIDNGEWVEGYYRMFALPMIYPNKPSIWSRDDKGKPLLIEDNNRAFEIDPATRGQCTEHKDKHGKLIFDGDILIRSNTNPVKIIVSIEKTSIGFSVVHRELKGNRIYSFCDKCEIIGNIYDNVDLIGMDYDNERA